MYENVKGLSKLSTDLQDKFQRIHKRHLSAMGTAMRKKYIAENLKEVKWVPKERCFHVFWKGNTDWFHYTLDGTWY
ncbi:hypothetical protein QA612_09855 [Evansella sp. AB-P1]|uniref:hypothetical protein n=1 Tax=Evansella sp. AB-P1 TaxID=3037653 RepID=UPI00241BECAD|nr:hypothetical protein [Evansella sp. AB-P1]MDG5787803.1 hypothetical protein [Evansella sp. AB-P1]